MKIKIICAVFLLGLLMLGIGANTNVSGQTPLTFSVYLPLINRGAAPSTFGAEISSGAGNFSESWPYAAQSGIYWIRRNGLMWSDIQPNNNTQWNWQNAAQLETELALIGRSGSKTILVIRSTPLWAQTYNGFYCGPMKANNIPDFANFVKQTVKRYSAAPYFVNYYELWNEPDVDRHGRSGDSEFGCWGEGSDPYYGGGYYAQMLSQVYPAVKSANPDAKVLIGGLLLDCDPTDPSSTTGCSADMKKSGMFFEGILKNGGGGYFDIVNFHGYPSIQSTITNPILLEKNKPGWKVRGGVVKGKLSFLREIMVKYNVNKPIFQSEAALRRDPAFVDASFEPSKADYLVWVFARNMTENMLGTTWYTLDGPGWFNSGLLDANQNPLPAYSALKYAVLKLSGAGYSGPLTFTGIEGFEYRKGTGRIWVVFRSGNTLPLPQLTLPAGYSAVYDAMGSPITPLNGKVTVEHPVYIDLAP